MPSHITLKRRSFSTRSGALPDDSGALSDLAPQGRVAELAAARMRVSLDSTTSRRSAWRKFARTGVGPTPPELQSTRARRPRGTSLRCGS